MKEIVKCDQCHTTASFFNRHRYAGVCGACFNFNKVTPAVYAQRYQDLLHIFSEAKKRSRGKQYDCIYVARADAEDFFCVHLLVQEGLSVLVVLTNNYFLTDLAWHNFHQLVTYFDVDSVTYNPNLHTYKELVRTSLRRYNSIYYPFKAILHHFVLKIASEKAVPLVVWGQCQPLEFDGKFQKTDELRLSEWWILEHELNGVTPERFLGSGAQLEAGTARHFTFPSVSTGVNREVIFLSNFTRWDQATQNSDALDFGFEPDAPNNTFDQFENAGSSVYYQLHDLLRVLNHGFPKLAVHLAREIRFGRREKLDYQDLTKFLAYDPAPFFKDFLNTTTSGYRWFLEHRLSTVQHLIREAPEINLAKQMASPKPLQNKNIQDFVIFKKGI